MSNKIRCNKFVKYLFEVVSFVYVQGHRQLSLTVFVLLPCTLFVTHETNQRILTDGCRVILINVEKVRKLYIRILCRTNLKTNFRQTIQYEHPHIFYFYRIFFVAENISRKRIPFCTTNCSQRDFLQCSIFNRF